MGELSFYECTLPPGISRPNLGMGIEATTGIFDSKTLRTAGKNDELYNSIFPTSSMMKRSVSFSTCTRYQLQYHSYYEQFASLLQIKNLGASSTTADLYHPNVNRFIAATMFKSTAIRTRMLHRGYRSDVTPSQIIKHVVSQQLWPQPPRHDGEHLH